MYNSKEQHLKLTSYIRIILVTAISIIFAGCLLSLFLVPMPEENRSAIDILVGSCSTLLGTIIPYYFGNSAGSGKSTDRQDTEEQGTTPEKPLSPKDDFSFEEEEEHHDYSGNASPLLLYPNLLKKEEDTRVK